MMQLRNFGCPHGRERSSAHALAESSAWDGRAGCRARDPRARFGNRLRPRTCPCGDQSVTVAQRKFKMPNGTTRYPEAVQLRLFSSQNSPHVKLVTAEDG